jgi:hypothetical protein
MRKYVQKVAVSVTATESEKDEVYCEPRDGDYGGVPNFHSNHTLGRDEKMIEGSGSENSEGHLDFRKDGRGQSQGRSEEANSGYRLGGKGLGDMTNVEKMKYMGREGVGSSGDAGSIERKIVGRDPETHAMSSGFEFENSEYDSEVFGQNFTGNAKNFASHQGQPLRETMQDLESITEEADQDSAMKSKTNPKTFDQSAERNLRDQIPTDRAEEPGISKFRIDSDRYAETNHSGIPNGGIYSARNDPEPFVRAYRGNSGPKFGDIKVGAEPEQQEQEYFRSSLGLLIDDYRKRGDRKN